MNTYKRFGWLLVPLLLLALVGCNTVDAASPTGEPQNAPDAGSGRTITVVGVGRVHLEPDVAEIIVGAEALAPTVAEAKAEVDAGMEAILAALTEQGIADKDIQTSNYSIYYERQPLLREGAPSNAEGSYRVSNTARVTVRDVEQAGMVLDAAVAAGANQVHGVTFTLSEDTTWQSMAREAAVADAQARATELATLAGAEVGQVLSISEVIGGSMRPVDAVERAMGGGGIAPGELELSTQVQVTFALQ